MKRLFSYFRGKNYYAHTPDWASMGDIKNQTIVLSPHKLIRIENLGCTRLEETVEMEFSLRNLGDEIHSYGLRMINNFDPAGHEFEYAVIFGKGRTSNGQVLHYTLPHDIPIKVKIRFFGVDADTRSLAQVKLIGLCFRKPGSRGYNPTGTILFRNVPIERIAPVTAG